MFRVLSVWRIKDYDKRDKAAIQREGMSRISKMAVTVRHCQRPEQYRLK